MSNIACPQCGASVAGSSANLSTLVARCAACDHVFRFEQQLVPAGASVAASPPAAAFAPLLPRPPRFIVTGGAIHPSIDTGYRTAAAPTTTPLVIRWRWFSPSAIFLLFFAIAWDSFLVFWYGIGFAADGPWIMFVFPLAHVAAGVAITYNALSSLLNVTSITVDANELRAVTGPIRKPFSAQPVLARGAVSDVSVVDKKGNRGSASYEVLAYDSFGATHKLARFDSRMDAEYLAQTIRGALASAGA